MDKRREELSLPSYMQAKAAKQASSASRAPKRAQPVASAPRKISLEEFTESKPEQRGPAPRRPASRTGSPQPKPRPQGTPQKRTSPANTGGSKPLLLNETAKAPRQTAQGELKTSPAPVRRGGQRSASSQRAVERSGAAGSAAYRAAPAKKPKPRRAVNSLDMTSSRIANQPRRTEERKQRKRGGLRAGRLLLVALLLAAVFGGVYALAKSLPNEAPGETIDVGATLKLPKGVSILGIDVGGQTKSAAKSAVKDAADALLAKAGITLKLGEETHNITASDMALSYDMDAVLDRALSYEPPQEEAPEVVDVTGSSEPGDFSNIFTYNPTALRGALEGIAASFNIEPVDAVGQPTMNQDHTVTFNYQEGKAGRALDVEATLEKIEALFKRGLYAAEIDGIFGSVEPAITGAMLSQEIGVRGSFTTRYPTIGKTNKETPTIENRVFNIHKASDSINGCMVAPGEEWSFNTHVGPRTASGGWKKANGIAYGKEYTLQEGGGICQVSTTLYNALLQAKVTVTERRAHSIPSDYVPKGLDATVDYAMAYDLKFVNDTGAPLYLFVYYEDVSGRHRQDITFVVYGKPLENGVRYETRSEIKEETPIKEVKYHDDPTIPRGYKVTFIEARDKFVADVYLDKYVGDGLVESEFLYTDKYAGNAAEAKRGTGSPKYNQPPPGAEPIS